jgi:hypothetical protein
MCNPVAIVLGIASTAGGIMAKQAASDAQDAAYEENLRASNQAKVDADRQINLQEAQAQEAAAQEQVANDLQSRELLARAVVAGGESGANGNSTLAYQQGIVRKGLEANTMVTQNLGRELAQMNESRLGQESTHTSRINSVSRGAGVGFGDVLGSAVQGAQVGISSASSLSTIKANKAAGLKNDE